MTNTGIFSTPLDTYVDQAKPALRYYGTKHLSISAQASNAKYAYLQFALAALPAGAIVTSAVLEVKAYGAFAAATVKVSRVTAAWLQNKMTYTNRPAVTTSGQVTSAVPATANGGVISLDVTAIVQAWASGQPNRGFRLETTATSTRSIHSAQTGTGANRPVLKITAYMPPAAPTGLTPGGDTYKVAVARPEFLWTPDRRLFRDQEAYRAIAYSDAGHTTEVWNSGWVTTTGTGHTAPSDLASGSTWYWGIQTRSTAGVESPMAYATVERVVASTVSILTPSATVNDAQFTVSWSVTGGTQLAWRVLVFDPDLPDVMVADSGWTTGSETSWTPSESTQVQLSPKTVRVMVVDTDTGYHVQPGAPAQVYSDLTVTYAEGVTTPATSLTATPTDPMPGMVLTAVGGGTPDEWVWLRDDVEIARTPGDTPTYTDYEARPRVAHTWKVRASTAEVNSTAVSATATITPKYIWLLDPEDPTWWLALAEQNEAGLAYSGESEAAVIRGAKYRQLIVDSLRGYEGTISGGVYESLPGLDGEGAQSLRDRVWHLKRNGTRVFRLIMSDQNIPVLVDPPSVQVQLRPGKELEFGIAMTVYQYGELPWEQV